MDLVAQDEVGDEPEGDEEDGEHDEVQVQPRVLHVQLPQDRLRLLEVTGVVCVAVQVLSVEPVDGEDDSLEPVSAEPRDAGV